MRLTEKTGTEKPSAAITTSGVVMKLSKPVKKRKTNDKQGIIFFKYLQEN